MIPWAVLQTLIILSELTSWVNTDVVRDPECRLTFTRKNFFGQSTCSMLIIVLSSHIQGEPCLPFSLLEYREKILSLNGEITMKLQIVSYIYTFLTVFLVGSYRNWRWEALL
jgi:hypothetical protein